VKNDNAVLDLALVRAQGCQWIGDQDPRATQLSYCSSKDLVEGQCYCQEHWPLMHKAGTALRKRKKDLRKANAYWDWESDFNDAVRELTEEGVLV